MMLVTWQSFKLIMTFKGVKFAAAVHGYDVKPCQVAMRYGS